MVRKTPTHYFASSQVLKNEFFLGFPFLSPQFFLKRADISAYKPFSFLDVVWHRLLELEDGKKKMGSRALFKKISCNQESSSPPLFPKT